MQLNDKMVTLSSATTCAAYNRVVGDAVVYKGHVEATIIRADGSCEIVEGNGITQFSNARVNAGWMAEANALFVSVPTTVFNYMALSSTAIAPATGDTTLSGELATNGMARYGPITPTLTAPTSVGGTGTIVFTHTWTASAPTTVNSIALLNAASAGTMYSEVALGSPATLNANDSLSVTYTLTK